MGRRFVRFRALAIGGVLLGIALAALAWGLGRRPADDPGKVIDEARAAMMDGRPDAAEAALERLATLRPPTSADRLMRADVARVRNRPDRALEELARIDDDAPDAALAREIEGQVEIRRGRLRPAEASLRRALALDPSRKTARRELIFILGQQMRRRELAEQIATLGRVEPLDFNDVWLWCAAPDTLGWIPDENIEILEGYLKADPDDRWTRLALADQYRRLTRYDDAEATLAPLPEADPEARVIRARIAVDEGDLSATERLLAEGPDDDPGLAKLRGRLALLRRDHPAAVAAFRAAEAAEPGHRETTRGLAQALRLAGDEGAAAPLQERATRLDALGALLERASRISDRADPDLIRTLGDACAALGLVPQARAWYRVAVARDPLDSKAQTALYRLDHGGSTGAPGPSDPSQ